MPERQEFEAQSLFAPSHPWVGGSSALSGMPARFSGLPGGQAASRCPAGWLSWRCGPPCPPCAATRPTRSRSFTGGFEDVCAYLRTPGDIADHAARLHARRPGVGLCFFGHTHEPGIFEVDFEVDRAGAPARVVARPRLCDGDLELERRPQRLVFVNPGSVDAARRPAKLAEFAIFDAATGCLRLREIPYDDERAERDARAQGHRMGRVDEALDRARRLLSPSPRRAPAGQ